MTSKSVLAATLDRSGLGRLLRRLGAWRGTLVLNYHRIGEASSSPLDHSLFSATPEDFDEHLAMLSREADVVGPGELLGERRRGRRVAITFDDGYRDNHDLALPILRAHRMPATFFVATGFLDRPRLAWWDEIAWMLHQATPAPGEDEVRRAIAAYKRGTPEQGEALLDALAARTGVGRAPASAADGVWMTWDMVRALHEAGMEIGGHSVDHPVLARLPAERQREQIEGCARRLREEIGVDLRWFSYPIGLPDTYDTTTQALLAEAGCRLAFTFAGGYGPPGHVEPLAFPRAGIQSLTTARRFRALLTIPQVYARW